MGHPCVSRPVSAWVCRGDSSNEAASSRSAPLPPRACSGRYWVAQAGMERAAALLPFPFYCFAKPDKDFVRLREAARKVMNAVVEQHVSCGVGDGAAPATREEVCAALGTQRWVSGGGRALLPFSQGRCTVASCSPTLTSHPPPTSTASTRSPWRLVAAL